MTDNTPTPNPTPTCPGGWHASDNDDHVRENHGPYTITVTYDQMVAFFGEPNSVDDGAKVDAAWDLEHPHLKGRVHVYNWKNGPAYHGHGTGLTVHHIAEFNYQAELPNTARAFRDAVEAAVSRSRAGLQ